MNDMLYDMILYDTLYTYIVHCVYIVHQCIIHLYCMVLYSVFEIFYSTDLWEFLE